MGEIEITIPQDIQSRNFKTPEFLEIKQNKNGYYGVFTKKPFKKDEKIYTTFCLQIPEKDFQETTYVYKINDVDYEFDTKIHCSRSEGYIYQYGWDGYFNHSCDNNTYFNDYPEVIDNKSYYDIVAKRDIEEGEELYSNYNNIFDIIPDKFDCLCGSLNCCKKVTGYKLISLDK